MDLTVRPRRLRTCDTLRRMVRDALLVNPYITEVDGFAVTQSGSTVTVACTVHTLYDSFETEVKLE